MVLMELIKLSCTQHILNLNPISFMLKRVIMINRVRALLCPLLELLVNVREVLGNVAEVLSLKHTDDAEGLSLHEVGSFYREQDCGFTEKASFVE